MINVSLVNVAPDIEQFNLISQNKYPFIFIGQLIKNKYDQERVCFKESLNPRSVVHPTANAIPVLKFFKGVEIYLKPEYINLVKRLEALNLNIKDSISLKLYEQILSEFNLSCNECSVFLEKGVYPINGTELKKITLKSRKDLSLTKLYEYNSKQVHFSQAISSNNIFILSNRNIYNFSNEKIIELYKKNNFMLL
jgi:hypothetical protein